MEPVKGKFTASFSPAVAELLYHLKCTIAISTYQAGKVIFISAVSPDKIVQLTRTFEKAMGLAVDKNKIAVAGKTSALILTNAPGMAQDYPSQPGVYDSLFLPRAEYYTGELSLHDMIFLDGELLAVNTLFSCISKINHEYSFTPVWKPPFISNLRPEDRCHLNGMALMNGKIQYVTALGMMDTKEGWRENKMNGGILMDVPFGEIILEKLAMPHSPRIHNNELYLLQSALGQLIRVDVQKQKFEIVVSFGCFARGLAMIGDYAFIGVSKLRHNTPAFKDLPIAETSFAGMVVIHLPTGKVLGAMKYEDTVDEIYDVKIIESCRRPNIINDTKKESRMAIVTKDQCFWALEEEKEK